MGEPAREPLPVVRIEHCVVHHDGMYLLRIGIPVDSMMSHLTGRSNSAGEEPKKNPLFVAIFFFIYEEKRFIYEESAQ